STQSSLYQSTNVFVGKHGKTAYPGFMDGNIDDVRIYNRVISQDEVVQLYYENNWPIQNDIVAYYPFNGDATDESGNGNDGTVNGATLTTDRFGEEKSAYEFDGIDDYIDVSNDPDFNFGTGNFTITAWTKTNYENSTRVVAKSNHDADDGYQFGISTTAHLYLLDSDPVVRSISEVNDNNWHQIVGVRNGDLLVIYVDGVKESTESGVGGWDVSTSHTLKIGCRDGNYPTYFKGIIDDIRIYNRTLTESEIDSLYHEGSWPALESESVLFFSDFNNLDGWINTDPEEFYITNNNLYFAARKGDVQHLYYPISITEKNFKITAKFKMTGNTANCFVCIGVTQQVYDIHDSYPLFNNSIALQPAYTAGDSYGNFLLNGCWRDGNGNFYGISEGSDWLSGYDGFKSLLKNTWYIGEICVSNNNWTLSLYDNGNNLIYSANNTCTSLGNEFNYFYIGNPTDYNFEYLYGEIDWVIVEQDTTTQLITLEVDSVQSNQGDTLIVPVQVQCPLNKKYDSAELTFSGYQDGLEFIGIDATQGMIIDSDWTYSVNETNSLLFTASAGANEISGSGVFCYLKFQAIGDICDFVPVNIESAVFNTGEDSVEITNGGVYIQPLPVFGDVDENSIVQAHDAALILKHLVGIDTLFCQSIANADVTNDKSISALDASIVLKYVVKLIDLLPCDTSALELNVSGDFYFTDGEFTPGEPVSIPLYLTKGENLLSFEAEFEYNPEQLSLVDIAWSDLLNGFTKQINPVDNSVKVAGAGSMPDGQEGVFATLQFVV
ncbi:MAG: LamG-like jellyroll fold domain-containing protein, partial [Bacteroidota bacterium]